MSFELNYRISAIIPVFTVFLLIASITGIVANGITLDTSDISEQSESDQISITIRIVLSSILTLLFLLLTIFATFEVLSPLNHKPIVLTSDVDQLMHNFSKKAESWELMMVISGIFFIPLGLGQSLIKGNAGYIIASCLLLIIPIYTYNNRIKIRESIRKILPTHSNINLNEFSRLIGRDRKNVKKNLLYLISFEKFPARFNFETEQIIYMSTAAAEEARITIEPLIGQSSKVGQTSVESAPCAYCGEKPLVPNAKFCSECGASMVSAK